MNSNNALLSTLFCFMLILNSCTSEAQQTANLNATPVSTEVIQFHSEHRCMTCNKIETLTKETLKAYPSIPFSLVNVDDVKNEKKAEQFQATGTALFLYDAKTGKMQELTDFAFMNAGNEDKFKAELKKKIDAFLK